VLLEKVFRSLPVVKTIYVGIAPKVGVTLLAISSDTEFLA
jgi:hypothetical protein